MTRFFFSSRLAWPTLAFFALAGSAAFAQTAASSEPVTPSAQLATTPAATSAFSSVFDSYQPFTEEKTVDWKQANDNTGRIGGWRVYAKEAAEPSPAMPPAPATAPAKP